MIYRWSDGLADHSMAEDILVELGSLIDRHPWWRARARLTQELLGRLGVSPPARVFDAGCGWGTTLEALERAGYRVTGADIFAEPLSDWIDRAGSWWRWTSASPCLLKRSGPTTQCLPST